MKKIRKRIMSLILTAILICTTFTSTVLAAETAPLLHISYTYGYTNDGVLGWTPGYVSYEIY